VTYEISPKNSATIEGEKEVVKGEDLSFTVEPGSKYVISSVKAADEELTSVSDESEADKTYELKDIEEDVTVAVTMETEVAHPAFHAEQTVNGVTITLDAEEGVLPEGVTMKAEEVTGQVTDDVRDAEEDESATVIAYDITLYDADGGVLANDAWNKNGSVTVNFSGDRITEASKDADQVDVLHVDDSGNVSDPLKTVDVQDGETVDSVTFDAEHFSTYVLWFDKAGNDDEGHNVTFYTYEGDGINSEIGNEKVAAKEKKWAPGTSASDSETTAEVIGKKFNPDSANWTYIGTTVKTASPSPTDTAVYRFRVDNKMQYSTSETENSWDNVSGKTFVLWYQSNNTHKVTWYVNGIVSKTTTVLDGKKPTYGGTPVKKVTDVEDISFAGWATEADSKTYSSEADLPVVNTDKTYYAIFTVPTYFYFLLPNGEYTSTSASNYMFAGMGKCIIPDELDRSDRWYKSAGYDHTKYVVSYPTDSAIRKGLEAYYDGKNGKAKYSADWSYSIEWFTLSFNKTAAGYDYNNLTGKDALHLDGLLSYQDKKTATLTYITALPDATAEPITYSKQHSENDGVAVNASVKTSSSQFTTDGKNYNVTYTYNNTIYKFDGWYTDSSYTSKANDN
jgi:hypothetical protein